MKCTGLLVFVMALLGGSSIGNAWQFDTVDPGFESGTGWNYTCDSYVTCSRTSGGAAHNGTWGMQFQSTVGWLSGITFATAEQREIYVTGGKAYVFSAWQKSVTPYAWISLRINWYDESSTLLSSDRVDFNDSLNNDWEFRSMTRTAPATAKSANITVIAVLHPWAARTVCIDDVYFVPVPAGLGNPGFEIDEGWYWGAWHIHGSGTDWVYLDIKQKPEAAHRGVLGLQVISYVGWLGSINMGVAEQPSVAVTGGTEYVFSAWQNSVTEFTRLSLAIEWFDAFNNSVGFDQADFGDSLNNDWELRSMTRTAPAAAARAKVTVMGIIHPWAMRTLYIDDVSFAPAQIKIPGDANNDGKVNVSDLGILATNYGMTGGATWEKGDFNNDQKVNVSDLGILATNYGYGMGRTMNFAQDAKAVGLVTGDDVVSAPSSDFQGPPQNTQKADAQPEGDPVTRSLGGCGSAGLPLIAGVLLMGMVLYKHEE